MGLTDDFAAVRIETVHAYVREGREEDLHLDFKNIGDPSLSRDDRKNLAIALSGFANSDGGIIVWGIDARPNDNKVDCAIGVREIRDVQLCLTRLNELTGQSVSPIVEGVFHRAITTAGSAGVCVSLIPASASGPHMAKGGEDRYYKRSGSAFYKLEHFDIADMFGRRHRSVLRLALEKENRGNSLLVSIKNEGRGIAKAPYLAIDLPQGFRASGYGFDGAGRFGLRQIGQYGNRCYFGGDAGTVIHVGQTLPITRLETTAQTIDGLPTIRGIQRFTFELAAEDVDLVLGVVEIDY